MGREGGERRVEEKRGEEKKAEREREISNTEGDRGREGGLGRGGDYLVPDQH